MQLKELHKITAFILAVLVLISTISFTIEKHYCGDTLVDVAVFSDGMVCGDMLIEKSCCENELEVIHGQDELKLSSYEDMTFEQQQFIVAYLISKVHGFEILPKATIPFENYAPPKLVYDVHLLDQVFLI